MSSEELAKAAAAIVGAMVAAEMLTDSDQVVAAIHKVKRALLD